MVKLARMVAPPTERALQGCCVVEGRLVQAHASCVCPCGATLSHTAASMGSATLSAATGGRGRTAHVDGGDSGVQPPLSKFLRHTHTKDEDARMHDEKLEKATTLSPEALPGRTMMTTIAT